MSVTTVKVRPLRRSPARCRLAGHRQRSPEWQDPPLGMRGLDQQRTRFESTGHTRRARSTRSGLLVAHLRVQFVLWFADFYAYICGLSQHPTTYSCNTFKVGRWCDLQPAVAGIAAKATIRSTEATRVFPLSTVRPWQRVSCQPSPTLRSQSSLSLSRRPRHRLGDRLGLHRAVPQVRTS